MKEFLYDPRRLVILPGDRETTIDYCAHHWLETARDAIDDHDFFAVALSGGSTPKAIYQRLTSLKESRELNWEKVYLFWSDERSVPGSDRESNYHMAMEEGGLIHLPILKENVFRMAAETDIEAHAKLYEELILAKLDGNSFDLVMLGVGEDGHTASLFPHTEALKAKNRLVVANHVPQKKTWRMTMTYECLNAANQICLYLIGANKAEIVEKVLTSPFQPESYPSQAIGTQSHKAHWILDEEASQNLLSHLK